MKLSQPSEPEGFLYALFVAFRLAYGLFAFTLFGFRAVIEGVWLKPPPEKFWDELEKARSALWDLGGQDSSSATHAFHTLQDGLQLHYWTNNPTAQQRKNLVVCIHGWPDNWSLWIPSVSELPPEDTTVVAIDLPGLGGSDGLQRCGCTEMMEAVTHFILALRERFASPEGKIVIAAHDWGALVGFHLAAEAPQLADRYVLSNSVLPALARDNITKRTEFSRRMIATWKQQPLKLRLLRIAFVNFLPVLKQLASSAYVFIFNLPAPLADASLTKCNLWSLRHVADLAEAKKSDFQSAEGIEDAARRLAGHMGPNAEACRTKAPYTPLTQNRDTYGNDVQDRVAKRSDVFESIRLYREGLAFRRWEKSLETMAALHNMEGGRRRRSSSSAGLIDEGPPGCLKAPTTILWGGLDPACNSGLLLEGIQDYLARKSQVIMLPQIGHWLPLEGEGPAVMREAIVWALEGETGDLGERLKRVCATSRVSVKS